MCPTPDLSIINLLFFSYSYISDLSTDYVSTDYVSTG